MRRCVRAVRFERPDLRRTEERANEAGALWRRIARKIMKLRERLEEVLLAPRAMPSAREWMTRPRVVEKEELLGEELDGWVKCGVGEEEVSGSGVVVLFRRGESVM